MPIIRRKNYVFATLGTCCSVRMTVWYAGCTLHTRQSSTQNNKYQALQKHSCFSWWWGRSHPKRAEIDKHIKNKLCTKLGLFTRLYRNARWTKHKIHSFIHSFIHSLTHSLTHSLKHSQNVYSLLNWLLTVLSEALSQKILPCASPL